MISLFVGRYVYMYLLYIFKDKQKAKYRTCFILEKKKIDSLFYIENFAYRLSKKFALYLYIMYIYYKVDKIIRGKSANFFKTRNAKLSI